MKSPLFSTYSTGENRVTASTIAVFERIDLTLVQEILESASGADSELPTVTFQNQVSAATSVPDAVIRARFSWHFETKTVRGVYQASGPGTNQLLKHLHPIKDDETAILFALTPDIVQPQWFSSTQATAHPRLRWISFAGIVSAVNDVLADQARLVSEQTTFLLRELINLYDAEGLLSTDDTVIVAAQQAWNEYLTYSAYVCQPNRSFRPGLTSLGFYRDGQIEQTVPKIKKDFWPSVVLDHATATKFRTSGEPELADLIVRLLHDGVRGEGIPHGIFLLSAPSDSDTTHLGSHIVNNTVAASGRHWAWTLGHRYTSMAKLKKATKTSDLA